MRGTFRKRGKTWSYVIDIGIIDGKRKQKEKGGFRTKALAEKACRQAIEELENRGKVFKENKITVDEYLDFWFETVARPNLRYNTLDLYERVMRNHIKPALGHFYIHNVGPAEMQKFLINIKSTYSNSQLNAIMNVLKGTFRLAVKQEVAKINPLNYVELGKKKWVDKKPRALTKEEYTAILDDVRDNRYYIPIQIALQTGARLGEILGLLWSDIDFENRTLSITKALQSRTIDKEVHLVLAETKTHGSVRTIALTKTLYEDLLIWQEKQQNYKATEDYYHDDGNDYICTCKNGFPINPRRLSTQMSRMSKRLDIPFTFHELRHTHATLMHEAGINIKVIQTRLGHSDVKTTLSVYSHLTQKMEDQAIEQLNQIFS